ncbi:MAG: histidine kinase N-terminal 7TM domain-containing protein [Anaerolineae bacterium]
MDWQLRPYIAVLATSAALSTIVAGLVFRHRQRAGATYLGLAMLATAEWSLAYIMEANGATIPVKVFWSKIAYLGTHAIAPLLLCFAVRFTDRDRWFTRPIRVVESIDDGVIVIDVRGRIVDANPAARQFVGRADLVGEDAITAFNRQHLPPAAHTGHDTAALCAPSRPDKAGPTRPRGPGSDQ